VASGRGTPTRLALDRASRDDQQRSVGLVKQRVRGAPQRGGPECAEATEADRDLVGVNLSRQLGEGRSGRPLDDLLFDPYVAGQGILDVAGEGPGTLSSIVQGVLEVGRPDELGRNGRHVRDDDLAILTRPSCGACERRPGDLRAVVASDNRAIHGSLLSMSMLGPRGSAPPAAPSLVWRVPGGTRVGSQPSSVLPC
jgi:hypothetical protein